MGPRPKVKKETLPRVIKLLYGFYPKLIPVVVFCIIFAAIVNSIPAAIIGGVSFILYGMISAIGVRNVVENRVDFTDSRNLIIAAVILVCGLGFTGGLTFQIGGASITLTSLAIAAIAGILLNAILPGNTFEFGADTTDTHPGDFGRY
jgi:uracil permease